MRTDIERLVYNTGIDWKELPLPIGKAELKQRLAARLSPSTLQKRDSTKVLEESEVFLENRFKIAS